MARAQEHQRKQLLDRIDNDTARVNIIKQTFRDMGEERRRMRDVQEAQKKSIGALMHRLQHSTNFTALDERELDAIDLDAIDDVDQLNALLRKISPAYELPSPLSAELCTSHRLCWFGADRVHVPHWLL
jgi:hypothetical protein